MERQKELLSKFSELYSKYSIQELRKSMDELEELVMRGNITKEGIVKNKPLVNTDNVETARIMENNSSEKAKKTLETLKNYVQSINDIGIGDEPYYLGLSDKTAIYFDSYQVCYEALKGYWLESEKNVNSYIKTCNNILVRLFMRGEESGRVVLGKNEELINDENDVLEIVFK